VLGKIEGGLTFWSGGTDRANAWRLAFFINFISVLPLLPWRPVNDEISEHFVGFGELMSRRPRLILSKYTLAMFGVSNPTKL
jgi:hypothetical protein